MKKRILFRIQTLSGGGAEKSLCILLQHLNYSKYEVDLLLDHKRGLYLDQIPKHIKVHYVWQDVNGRKSLFTRLIHIIRRWKFLKELLLESLSWRAYKLILKDKKYDVEIAFIEGLIPSLVKSPLPSRKIAWIHIDVREMNFGARWRNAILSSLKEVDTIVIVSKQAQASLLALAPSLKPKVQVVYNPIDCKEVIERSHQQEIKREGQGIRLLSIGRLSWQKGFDRLIDVCHRLKGEEFDFKLSILGEGPLKRSLESQISRLGMHDEIELLGFKENPYPYLRAGDIFVLSSHVEGLPYVILEALILDKAIVSTDITGPRELLKEGELGLLVENSEEGLYEGLKKMIIEGELRASFAEKKKDFSPFDPKHMVQQCERLLDE